MALPFTLVTTVFNEAARLPQTLADLDAQILPPTEVIIVDAGSKDGTQAILAEWAARTPYPVKVIVELGCNIAQGRNRAIKEAAHDLIVSTDFGCRYDPRWLASLIARFEADPELQVVGGAFTILPDEVRTPAARADYILANGYPPDTGGLFSVSSRSIAYKKQVWEQLGGYQEWLTLAADDTIFWRQIKHGGYRYKLVDEPYVYWLRHTTFTGFGKESYRYGLGDGESGINRRNLISIISENGLRFIAIFGLVLFITSFIFSIWHLILFNSDKKWPTWMLEKANLELQLNFFSIIPLLFISRFAFRPYRAAWRNYKALRRKPGPGATLTFTDWLRACYLVEVNRIYYVRGFLRGWLGAPAKVRAGRAGLGALPA